jgi:IS30 family transposase
MAHTELGLRERRTIEDMLNAKISVDKIAAEIGRHSSTVFREIKRNKFVDDELPKLNGYYGMSAQRTAVNRRAPQAQAGAVCRPAQARDHSAGGRMVSGTDRRSLAV